MNRKTSPCSPRALNLLHVLPSRMVGWNELCNPGKGFFCHIYFYMIMEEYLVKYFTFIQYLKVGMGPIGLCDCFLREGNPSSDLKPNKWDNAAGF